MDIDYDHMSRMCAELHAEVGDSWPSEDNCYDEDDDAKMLELPENEVKPKEPEFDHKEFLKTLSWEDLKGYHIHLLKYSLNKWPGFSLESTEQLVEFDAELDAKQYKLAAKSYMFKKSAIISPEKLEKWKINYYKEVLQLDKKNTIVAYDRFNPLAMKWLIKNKSTLCHRFGVKINDINNLLKLDAISHKGWCRIYYRKTQKYSKENNSLSLYGRVFALKAISLQSLCKKFRSTLSRGISFEADISNCHPCVLEQVCLQHGVESKYIREYRDNREQHLKDLMEANNITRSFAKDVFISAMYSDEHGSKLINQLQFETPFLTNLRKEFCDALKIIVDKNPVLYEDMKNTMKKKHKRKYEAWLKSGSRWEEPKQKASAGPSVVSYFMQDIENQILQTSIQFYKDKGIIKHDAYSMIYDGVLLPKQKLRKWIKLKPKLIELIKTKLNIDIGFAAKNWGLETKNPDKYEFIQCDDPELIYAYQNAYKFEHGSKKSMQKLKEYYELEAIKAKHTSLPYTPIDDSDANKGDFIANIELEQQRLPAFDTWINNNRTLIVRSGMGSCKTKRLYEYLDNPIHNEEHKKILIISFRKSLERKYINDLGSKGFVLYDDITVPHFDSNQFPRLIVQINSLWRVVGDYNIVLLDEISYTLDTLIDYSQHKTQITQALKSYIVNADKVICMDAFLTNVESNYIKSIRGESGCLIVNNTQKYIKGECVVLQENNFIETMMDKLKNGERIVIASNVKRFLTHKLQPLLKANNITYKLITRDSAELTTINDWGDYQLIGYSPTIVAGLSFEIPKIFDARFGYFSNLSATPDICIQMLFRVRSTKERKIYLSIKNANFGSKDFPITEEEIAEWLNIYVNLDRTNEFKNLGVRNETLFAGWLIYDNFKREYVKDSYYYLVLNYFRKRFLSKKFFGNRLMYYLKEQGWRGTPYIPSVTYIQELQEKAKESNKIIKEYKMEQVKATADEYRKAARANIDQQYFDTIEKKLRKTQEEKVAINTYVLQNTFNLDFEKADDKTINSAVKNFFYHKFEHGFQKSGAKTPMKFVKKELSTIPVGEQADWHIQRKRDFFLRAYRLLEIIKVLGFNGLFDLDKEFEMNDDNIKKVSEYIQKNINDFIHLFNFSNKDNKYKFLDKNGAISKQSFVQIMNSLLKRIGRKLHKERNRTKVDGKMVDNSKYYFVSIITNISKKQSKDKPTEVQEIQQIAESMEIDEECNSLQSFASSNENMEIDERQNHNGNWVPPEERL